MLFLAMLPALVSFDAGDPGQACVAAAHGWRRTRPAPSAADLAAWNAPIPTPSERDLSDPAAGAAFRAEQEKAANSPELRRVAAYNAWMDGPGACISPSRTRLLISGGVIVAGAAMVVAVRRASSQDA